MMCALAVLTVIKGPFHGCQRHRCRTRNCARGRNCDPHDRVPYDQVDATVAVWLWPARYTTSPGPAAEPARPRMRSGFLVGVAAAHECQLFDCRPFASAMT